MLTALAREGGREDGDVGCGRHTHACPLLVLLLIQNHSFLLQCAKPECLMGTALLLLLHSRLQAGIVRREKNDMCIRFPSRVPNV